MKELKVSAVVGLAVTVLAVVIAFAFSFATISYQKEVVSLKKTNAEYRNMLNKYQAALESIKNEVLSAGIKVQ